MKLLLLKLEVVLVVTEGAIHRLELLADQGVAARVCRCGVATCCR